MLLLLSLLLPAFGQNGSVNNDFGLPGTQRRKDGIMDIQRTGPETTGTKNIQYAFVDVDTLQQKSNHQ
ncbi:MAG TPA: hypothetical protein VFL76_04500 [Edaphocola sp.]|nr:hypothetical protein [Edaphocola sp.]